MKRATNNFLAAQMRDCRQLSWMECPPVAEDDSDHLALQITKNIYRLILSYVAKLS